MKLFIAILSLLISTQAFAQKKEIRREKVNFGMIMMALDDAAVQKCISDLEKAESGKFEIQFITTYIENEVGKLPTGVRYYLLGTVDFGSADSGSFIPAEITVDLDFHAENKYSCEITMNSADFKK